MKALVLSGGGARGAYQVGVLNAVADIVTDLEIKNPFKIYTGVSAGAINASFMAAGSDDFLLATKRLTELWSNIHFDNVFKTDAVSLGKIGLKWMGELSLGGVSGAGGGRSLLDTAPLAELVRNSMDFHKVQKNIDAGYLHALGITAVDYGTSKAITFVQGDKNISPWNKSRRKSQFSEIKTEHVMASAAIPILFPSIEVQGRYFGDGCVRNLTPCSPAIRLGAEELFVIGVRKNMADDDTHEVDISGDKSPSVAKVINVLLNAILLDGVEADIDRIKGTNRMLDHMSAGEREAIKMKPLKPIFIYPQEDIGDLAAKMTSKMPRVIRYLLKGLGPMEEAKELISYLMFEPSFCKKLIDMGYQDALSQKEEIVNFFKS